MGKLIIIINQFIGVNSKLVCLYSIHSITKVKIMNSNKSDNKINPICDQGLKKTKPNKFMHLYDQEP